MKSNKNEIDKLNNYVSLDHRLQQYATENNYDK